MHSHGYKTQVQPRRDVFAESSNEVKNVLDSMDVAAIFLDNELRVRTFTRMATDIVSLTIADIGRPVNQLTSTLVDTDIPKLCRLVLLELAVQETEVRGSDDHCFFMRVRPYRNIASVVEGVVITFQDITEQKRAVAALRDSEIKCRTMLEGSPVCNKIISLDSRLLYMSAAGIEQLRIPDIQTYYGGSYPPAFYSESMRAPLVEHLERAKTGEICSVECPVLDTCQFAVKSCQ